MLQTPVSDPLTSDKRREGRLRSTIYPVGQQTVLSSQGRLSEDHGHPQQRHNTPRPRNVPQVIDFNFKNHEMQLTVPTTHGSLAQNRAATTADPCTPQPVRQVRPRTCHSSTVSATPSSSSLCTNKNGASNSETRDAFCHRSRPPSP